MALEKLCPPALIYIIFSLVNIVLDTLKGNYSHAFMKMWVALLFTILLNYLCMQGMSVISWIIVFIPFLFMSFITTILMVVFGLNPETGKYDTIEKQKQEEAAKIANQKTDTREHAYQDAIRQEQDQQLVEDIKTGNFDNTMKTNELSPAEYNQ